MSSSLVIAVFILTTSAVAADYPGKDWAAHNRTGWSDSLLKAAREYMATQKTQSVMIVQSGHVVDQWGDVTRKIPVRSVRKSFLNALYGIHVAAAVSTSFKTLGELGIDDNAPSLSRLEKQATVLDLWLCDAS